MTQGLAALPEGVLYADPDYHHASRYLFIDPVVHGRASA